MSVDRSPVLPREREDRKRRKEHERKSTKRTDEVEQQNREPGGGGSDLPEKHLFLAGAVFTVFGK